MDSIKQERDKIEAERLLAIQRFVFDYDSKVLEPKLREIQKRCGLLGHNWQFYSIANYDQYECLSCGLKN